MLNKLKFWCNKVIPLVYDEALSYYEVLCKVAHKINELVESNNELYATTVFKVNDVEPVDGNVTLTPGDFEGFVGSVNSISPVDGNVTITGADISGVVRTVNGFSPDSNGDVNAGTVRSVNGKSPTSLPTPGSITLNATDVGALPNSIDPVETVNGISPDTNGNVNVGTVKSVNGTLPDNAGNVNLPTVAGVTSVNGIGPDGTGNVNVGTVKSVNSVSPDANGNVSLTVVSSVNSTSPDGNGNVNVGTVKSINSISPDANGNIAIEATNSVVTASGTINTTNCSGSHSLYKRNGFTFLTVDLTLAVAGAWGTELITDIPDVYGVNTLFLQAYGDRSFYRVSIDHDSGKGKLICAMAIPTGTRLLGTIIYMTDGDYSIPIVQDT